MVGWVMDGIGIRILTGAWLGVGIGPNKYVQYECICWLVYLFLCTGLGWVFVAS